MPVSWSTVQKLRGIKLILTRFPARNCWKKMIAGKVHYFQHPDSEAGYTAACLELAILTGADKRSKAIQERKELIAVASQEQAELLKAEIAEIESGVGYDGKPIEVVTGGKLGLNVDPLRHMSEAGKAVFQDRKEQKRKPHSGCELQTLGSDFGSVGNSRSRPRIDCQNSKGFTSRD